MFKLNIVWESRDLYDLFFSEAGHHGFEPVDSLLIDLLVSDQRALRFFQPLGNVREFFDVDIDGLKLFAKKKKNQRYNYRCNVRKHKSFGNLPRKSTPKRPKTDRRLSPSRRRPKPRNPRRCLKIQVHRRFSSLCRRSSALRQISMDTTTKTTRTSYTGCIPTFMSHKNRSKREQKCHTEKWTIRVSG